MSRPRGGFPEVLSLLEPLKGGSRPRELLVAVGSHWTAYFDGGLNGGDPISAIGHLSRTVKCQGVAVRTNPHTYDRVKRPSGRMGSVQFQLFGPLDTDFLNYVRGVSVTFTGSRWEFHANGTEQVFEEPEVYETRRVRDHFTTDMLERYCQALGIDVFSPGAYGPGAVLLTSHVRTAPGGYVMTLAEVQEYLGIVSGFGA
ncbi:hypothetical protein BMS3Bbin02_00078 [bacterium BMS3Bbin02]|nr:hypothetical protein BMS3Bbin02_00078 [bacterium BMS3Bbin02]